jgi:transcriptional regulator
MYVPGHFAEDDASRLTTLMRAYSFATLVTIDNGAPFASHIPFLFDADRGRYGTLLGHVARANPQWRHFAAGSEALVIFQGPHAYVSPSWYAGELNVPTWNYAVVHATGQPRVIDDPTAVRTVIDRLVATYEAELPEPWTTERLPTEFVTGLLRAIVAFEIPITRLEGKYKLSQNKGTAEQRHVIEGLRSVGGAAAGALAELMAAQAT